jgi:hypothetical protein
MKAIDGEIVHVAEAALAETAAQAARRLMPLQ